jgi:streptogrisin C
MQRRLALRAVVTLASVGVAASLASASPAAANPSGVALSPSDASPEIVAAMQRDFNLSAAQVKARLAREAAAARTESELRLTLDGAYGGAWLNADASALQVAVTSTAQAGLVRAAGATPVLVSRTEAQLDAVKGKLDAAGKPSKTVAGWFVDVASNTVVVVAQSAAAGAAFVASSGADASSVRVVVSSESPQPLYDVRGGDAYYMGGRCSVGFSVNGGFVTAGHCGSTGTATQGFNQVAQGTFRGSSFPGNDYAWVQVNSNWVPRGIVNNYSGGNVTVSGSTESAVGASICRSGSTTGWHCGTVQAKNSTVNYPQGTVTGLTRTNVCAEPGDSGGSWLSGSQAQGVTSGGSGNCTSGGTTYFQPVNEILSVYGLTLVTGGSNPPPPPPPPTGCASYESRFNGSLSGTGVSQYQPNGSYFQAPAGQHQACLDGPTGVDFDLYLQRWNGAAWATVASATSPNPDETLTYNGSSGYYRYRVYSYRGSGSYTLGINAP